jgi:hypothetical protein
MSKLTQTISFLCLLAFCTHLSAATASGPDERDREVLETVLLHLLADPEFEMARVPTDEAVIVLHVRTPEKIGFLSSNQIRIDTGNHTLPADLEAELRRRNTPPESKPHAYDAVSAFYTNLPFSPQIVVADLSILKGDPRRSHSTFQKAHPKAKGFVKAYLPGYSKEGSRALVRSAVGPSPHGAMVTALLEKRGDQWVVKWHHIARYA